mgnify:FL=1
MNVLQTVFTRTSHWFSHWLQAISTLEMTEQSQYQPIEFVGGPFDGHVERVTTETIYQIPPVLSVPITRAQFDRIDGMEGSEGIEPASIDRPTSIAHYDLVSHRANWQFRFSHQSETSADRHQTGTT